MSIESYGVNIHLEKGNKVLSRELVEHKIDYEKNILTYTTKDRQMGIIPYDRIINIEFDSRLMLTKEEQNNNKTDKK